jgi:hypothetical protein
MAKRFGLAALSTHISASEALPRGISAVTLVGKNLSTTFNSVASKL